MKRHYLLSFLLVATAFAVMILQMDPAPQTSQEAGKDFDGVTGQLEDRDDPNMLQEEAPTLSVSESDNSMLAQGKLLSEAGLEVAEAKAGEAPESVEEKIKGNLQEARQVFQQKAAIAKAKPEEVHHMPKPTLDAARRLGEIVELEAQHPEQVGNFREFYLECARDEKTITVIRAQCLDRYVKVAKMDSAGQTQLLKEFSEDILRLFEALQ